MKTDTSQPSPAKVGPWGLPLVLWAGLGMTVVGGIFENSVTGTVYAARVSDALFGAQLLMLGGLELSVLGYGQLLKKEELPTQHTAQVWLALAVFCFIPGNAAGRGELDRFVTEGQRTFLALAGQLTGGACWIVGTVVLTRNYWRLDSKQRQAWEQAHKRLFWVVMIPTFLVGIAVSVAVWIWLQSKPF